MFPDIPWYTVVALGVLLVAFLGLLFGLVGLCFTAWWRVFGSVWRLLSRLAEYYCDMRLVTHGSARFAYPRDVTRAGGFREEGLPLAQMYGRVVREPANGHVLLCAPPRSGKSWGVLMPAIKEYPGSVVVTDLRGELYRQTRTAREQMSTVYHWAPTREDSCNINMLDNCQDFPAVQRLVHHLLLGNHPVGSPPNPFAEAALPLLTSIIRQCQHAGRGNLPAVRAWMMDASRSVQEKLDTLLASPLQEVQEAARQALDQSPNLRASAWNAALAPLAIFGDERIAAHSRTSDIPLAKLCTSTEPVTLYLSMSFGDIGRLGGLIGALIEQLCTALSAAEEPPRHRLLLALDETANLQRCPELERGMTHLAGSSCQAVTVWQSVGQIHQLYGQHSPMLSSVGSALFYRPQPTDRTTAEFISHALGQQTVGSPSLHVGQGLSEGTTATGRPLLTSDEVTRLAPDQALCLLPGSYPILAHKLGVTPATLPWLQYAIQRSPWVASTAAACALMVFCLWPLWSRPARSPVTVASTSPLHALLGTPAVSQATAPMDTGPQASAPSAPAAPHPALEPMPTTTPPVPAPAPAPAAPPHVPAKWQIRAIRPGASEGLQGVLDVLPTKAACLEMLRTRFKRNLELERSNLENLAPVDVQWSPEADRVQWTVRPRNKAVESHSAWCEVEGSPPPAPTPSPLQWVLQASQPGMKTPAIEARFEQEAACTTQLKQRYEPHVDRLSRQLAASGMQRVEVKRDNGRLSWTIHTKGGPDAEHSVWCQKEG